VIALGETRKGDEHAIDCCGTRRHHCRCSACQRVIGLKQRQAFQAAVKGGRQNGFGTDAGVYPNGYNARQFVTMVKWGMTPMQAIQAATANAAEALGRQADVGAIAVGRYGDLIAVAGDPLADFKLQSVVFVMKGGEIVKAAGN
jgi:imidazolonepropionase-like amidohydrolase